MGVLAVDWSAKDICEIYLRKRRKLLRREGVGLSRRRSAWTAASRAAIEAILQGQGT